MNLIVALCKKNNGIGFKNKIPWNLKEELQYFCNAINANNIDFSNIDFSIRSLEIALEINNIIQSKLNQ